VVALLVGHRTCDLQVAGSMNLRLTGRRFDALPRHHCTVALGKLLTPVCLCHQAV